MSDVNFDLEGLEDLVLDNLKPNYNIWLTNQGDYLELREMDETHLINTIKMLYNSILFPNKPLSDNYIRWSIKYLSKLDAMEYIISMFEELNSRNIEKYNYLRDQIYNNIRTLSEFKYVRNF